MVDRREMAYQIVHSAAWEDFLLAELTESRDNALEEALISRDMQELSRNQGWVACLEWVKNMVEDLANEHEELNSDE